ncbi:MAG TPA: hypothetical protein VFQ59_02720 [Candidatus Paceibacterota bacterium]|nr:hypothetical protein [Candidatus Paceibacterota bacterium]
MLMFTLVPALFVIFLAYIYADKKDKKYLWGTIFILASWLYLIIFIPDSDIIIYLDRDLFEILQPVMVVAWIISACFLLVFYVGILDEEKQKGRNKETPENI